jgi:hypothetical protein
MFNPIAGATLSLAAGFSCPLESASTAMERRIEVAISIFA